MRPLTGGFVRRAAQLCSERGVPLIADECQTGLGRIGRFLASRAFGVLPDYVVLSKALGGGLAKISALLIDRWRYRPEFDLLHGSTFADDEFSCAIALRTLELLDRPTIRRCRSEGTHLLRRLRALQAQFPGAIAEVRGAGLMIGIELRRPAPAARFLLNFLAERQLLGPLIAAYLLREHRVRIAPTLSDPLTLRVQPSAFIEREQLERFVEALADVCRRLEAGDAAGLTRFLWNSDRAAGPGVWPFATGNNQPNSNRSASNGSSRSREGQTPSDQPVFAYRPDEFRRREAQQRRSLWSPPRVAWLFHLIDADDLPHLDPALAELSQSECEAFLRRFAPLAEPVAMDAVEIVSQTGAEVRLYPIMLPVTSRCLLEGLRNGRRSELRGLVQRGVDAASALGCRVVSLGQFTSIVTRNGRSLRGSPHITTGNSYTAALVVQAVRRAVFERGVEPAESTLAVVGATGDIGRTCATTLGRDFDRTILVGRDRPAARGRLQTIAARLPRAEAAYEITAVRRAEVVVCATNCVDAPLGPEHLLPEAIVCDVSIPSTVHPRTAALRPDLTIVPGAVVRLPGGEDLGIPGFPLPPGQAYGCLAEGLLLALEGFADGQHTGQSSLLKGLRMLRIAEQHGFQLAESEWSALCRC